MKLAITYTMAEITEIISAAIEVITAGEQADEVKDIASSLTYSIAVNGTPVQGDDEITVTLTESGLLVKILKILAHDAKETRDVMEAIRESVEKKEPAGSGEDL